MTAGEALVAEVQHSGQSGIPEVEEQALRDLVRGVERAAPLLASNPARCRGMEAAHRAKVSHNTRGDDGLGDTATGWALLLPHQAGRWAAHP